MKTTDQKNICDEITLFGKGLGNENRYTILQLLMKGPRTVGEIAEATGIAQPAVSQNLKIMKEANMVTDNKQGQAVYYAVDTAQLIKLLKQLATDVESCKKISQKK